MHFDLHTVPFSRFGSYMCFNFLPEAWNLPGLIFRTMHVTTGFSRELMRVELLAGGAVVQPAITATPSKLTLGTAPAAWRYALPNATWSASAGAAWGCG